MQRRGSREAFTLILSDELVIGQPLLVQVGSLLLHLCLSSFSRRLLLGYASSSLSDFRSLSALVRRLTMLTRYLLSAPSQLPLAGGNSCASTRPR